MSMRVLVIGGVVFIGREIVRRLADRGHEVTVLHRRPDHDLGPAVQNVMANRTDLDALRRVLAKERYDAVVDTAYDWEKGTTPEHVEAAARACANNVQRFVFISSAAVYGPGHDHPETDALVPGDFPEPYMRNKAGAERALFRMHAASGFPVTTLRPPFVHGPRQPFYREQFFWDRLLDGRSIILPDGGDTPIQWAFVSDLAAAAVQSIDVPEAAGEAFNMAHREPLTQRTFIEALARTAGVTPSFVDVSRAAIHAAGGQLLMNNLYFGEMLDLPPITTRVDKAPRVLGVEPTPLESALAETFAWYRTQPRRSPNYEFEDRLMTA